MERRLREYNGRHRRNHSENRYKPRLDKWSIRSPDELAHKYIFPTTPTTPKYCKYQPPTPSTEDGEEILENVSMTMTMTRPKELSDEVSRELEISICTLMEIRSSKRTLKRAQPCKIPLSNTGKKILLLDLDNTLIFALHEGRFSYEHIEQRRIIDTPSRRIPIVKRPHLPWFLHKMSAYFDIWVFTAGETHYASDIINAIDPTEEYIMGALTRTNCAIVKSTNTKRLFMFKTLKAIYGRKKEDIVILDDSITAWPNDLNNLITIPSYYGDNQDIWLQARAISLVWASCADDARTMINKSMPLAANAKYLMNTKYYHTQEEFIID